MADYCRVKVTAQFAESSDYSDAVTREYTYTPTTAVKVAGPQFVVAAAGGKTVELGGLSSVLFLVVKNKSTTLTTKATWRSAATGASDIAQNIPPGGAIVLTDVAVATDLVLTEATSAAECEVFVVGA
jgi:hypothetical protein